MSQVNPARLGFDLDTVDGHKLEIDYTANREFVVLSLGETSLGVNIRELEWVIYTLTAINAIAKAREATNDPS